MYNIKAKSIFVTNAKMYLIAFLPALSCHNVLKNSNFALQYEPTAPESLSVQVKTILAAWNPTLKEWAYSELRAYSDP